MENFTVTMFVTNNSLKTVNVFDYDIVNFNHSLRDIIDLNVLGPINKDKYGPGIQHIFKNSKYYVIVCSYIAFKYNYHTKTLSYAPVTDVNHGIMYKDHLIVQPCSKSIVVYNIDLEPLPIDDKYYGFILYDNKLYTCEPMFDENPAPYEPIIDEESDLNIQMIEIDFTPDFTATAVNLPNIGGSFDPRFGEAIRAITSNPDFILANYNNFYPIHHAGNMYFYTSHVRIFNDVYFSVRCYDLQLRKMANNELLFSGAGNNNVHWIVEA